MPITTSGDRQQGPIGAASGVGVFTREIQRGLLDRRIDLAVHSLKDLPTEEVPGLCLAAVPQRGPLGDALVCRQHGSLQQLPQGALLGTGSLRRQAQLGHARPDLSFTSIRGNVDTRLRKLAQGECDGVVLAEAGLRRLGLAERITQLLPLSIVLPAVGQGALGLETRSDDQPARDLVEQLSHLPTHQAVSAERAMMAALQGGCRAPVAGWGRIEDEALVLSGRVLNADGTQMVEVTLRDTPDAAARLGSRVAEELIAQGAAELIRASRDHC